MSGRRARAGVPVGTCQWSGQFLCAASTSYTTVCTHSEQSHSCRQGCSHGHTVAAPLPRLQRLQQTPRGRGLNPRCLFLTLCRLDVQLPRLLRTDRFPPSSISGIFSLCPHLAEGRRESERAQSPDAIWRFHPHDLPQGPPSTYPHPGLGLEQAVYGINGLRCAVFSVETAGVWVGKEFLDTEHFRRE